MSIINRAYALTSSHRQVGGSSHCFVRACDLRLAHFWQLRLRVILLAPKGGRHEIMTSNRSITRLKSWHHLYLGGALLQAWSLSSHHSYPAPTAPGWSEAPGARWFSRQTPSSFVPSVVAWCPMWTACHTLHKAFSKTTVYSLSVSER